MSDLNISNLDMSSVTNKTNMCLGLGSQSGAGNRCTIICRNNEVKNALLERIYVDDNDDPDIIYYEDENNEDEDESTHYYYYITGINPNVITWSILE